MSKQSFLKGTFILVIAGFITRVLGFINRIVVARVMGEEGVGLYMMTFPTFLLLITLTQIGLPVAISKFVAEAEAMNNRKKVKQILVVSLAVTGTLSMVLTSILVFFAPFLAEHLLGDSRTYYALMATLPVVPIIAISSVLRGYFQGKQDMKPGAYASVIEQVVRIVLVYSCTKFFMPYGVQYAAMGAMISSVFGELASLIYTLSIFKFKQTFRVRKNFFSVVKDSKGVLKELLSIAIPTTGSRLIGSLAFFIEPILISQSFLYIGLTASEAARQYGQLSGYVLPLLQLPSFITVSLSISLVPAISEALAMKKFQSVERRLQQAIRLSLVSGGLAVVLIYIYAEPILMVMYGTSASAYLMKIIAPFFLFFYFQGPLQAAMQAMDLAKEGMMNTLYGVIMKSILMVLLTTQTNLQIVGVALGYAFGVVLTTLLHFSTILKHLPFSVYPMDYIKTLFVIAASGYGGFYFYNHFSFDVLWMKLLIATLFTSLLYCLLLVGTGLIKKNELKRLPIIGGFIR